MKRKILSIMLVVLLLLNPVLPWMHAKALAANAQTLSIEDQKLYDKLKAGITPKSALKSTNDAGKSIELDMNQVTKIEISLSGVDMAKANTKENVEKLLGGCGNLEMLHLKSGDLSGIDFSSLKGRSSLTSLYLVDGKLESVPELDLPNLKTLCLAKNKLSASGACVNIRKDRLPNLTSLYLDACGISNIDFLQGMEGLQKLYLGDNLLRDNALVALLAMDKLSGLVDLNLGVTAYDGFLTSRPNRSSGNKFTDVDSLASIPSRFPNLTELDLSGLQIASLQKFSGVREDIKINFERNKLIDFTGIESHAKFVIGYQNIFYSGTLAKGWGNEIPELMQRVLNQDDALKGSLSYENCALSRDGTLLVIQPDSNSACVKVESGKLSGTSIFITSLKSLPAPAVPDNLAAMVGDTLARVSLPDGFAWREPAQDVGAEGVNRFQADYTLWDGGHRYVMYDMDVPVTVSASSTGPAKPTVAPTPTPMLPTSAPSPTPMTPTSVPMPTQPASTDAPMPTMVPTKAPNASTPAPTVPAVSKQPLVTSSPKPDESKMTGNQIEKRKDLSLLLAAGKQKGSSGIKLTWRKKNGCSGYEVYWSYCDGKQNYKKLKSVGSSGKRQCVHKKLKKSRAYKYYIVSYVIKNGIKKYQSKSPVIHVAMRREKHTNAKRIKVNRAKVTLKGKGTFQIKARAVLENRKKKLLGHDRKFRYYVDNRDVATVSKKGKIRGKEKGTCSVFVTANNGVAKQMKVTVK